MNHKKFIQLLNLYIDGEATPAEVVEIESEIEHDPARRRIYHEYCRIQTATRAVYHQFRTAAEESRPDVGVGRLRAAGVRSASAHPGRVSGPPFRRFLFWAGGATAACAAVAVAFWSAPRGGTPRHSLPAPETAGMSVPTVEAPVAVAVSKPAPAAYSAPLAAATGSDPYRIQTSATGADPFALGTPPSLTALGDPELVLGALPNFEPARFVPASTSGVMDPARLAEQNRKLQTILRSGIAREAQGPSGSQENPPQATGQGQGPFVPVNYRQQP